MLFCILCYSFNNVSLSASEFAYTGLLYGIDGPQISCLASAMLTATLLVVQGFTVKMNILVQFW